MIKENGYIYCDHCHKYIVPEKIIKQNKDNKEFDFCSWMCAYKGLKPWKPQKIRLGHLSHNEKGELLRRLNYNWIGQVDRLLKNHDIDGRKFTDIVLSDEPQKRRDDFYALFKDDSIADKYWTQLMGWYYGYTEEEIDAEMWETFDRVHAYLRMAD